MVVNVNGRIIASISMGLDKTCASDDEVICGGHGCTVVTTDGPITVVIGGPVESVGATTTTMRAVMSSASKLLLMTRTETNLSRV